MGRLYSKDCHDSTQHPRPRLAAETWWDDGLRRTDGVNTTSAVGSKQEPDLPLCLGCGCGSLAGTLRGELSVRLSCGLEGQQS